MEKMNDHGNKNVEFTTVQELLSENKLMDPMSIGTTSLTSSCGDLYDEPVRVNVSLPQTDLMKYGIYERYQDVTFQSISSRGVPGSVDKQVKQVAEYAKHLEENLKQGRGLILRGGVGTMKTSLAIAVMRVALNKSKDCYFIPMVSLLDTLLTNSEQNKRNDFEEKIRNVELLVLDDLGAEYDKEWILAKVDSIITERYNRLKSTIITTNIGNDGFKSRYNQRILDRLRQANQWITFKGDSLR